MSSTLPPPVTFVQAADQQHLLFLFVPIYKGILSKATQHLTDLRELSKKVAAGTPPDLRAATGVHFFMFYPLADGHTPTNSLGHNMFVPSFQTFPGKDLLAVISIYDADFAPYISAFVTNKDIAGNLNKLLMVIDESNIPGVDANGPTSAKFILANGGVQANPDAFNCLLMRYNFADPTIAAGSTAKTDKYTFGTTFPGMTVRSILQNYNGASGLYPWPPAKVAFAKSVKPTCGS